jgi:hypothetical protein
MRVVAWRALPYGAYWLAFFQCATFPRMRSPLASKVRLACGKSSFSNGLRTCAIVRMHGTAVWTAQRVLPAISATAATIVAGPAARGRGVATVRTCRTWV